MTIPFTVLKKIGLNWLMGLSLLNGTLTVLGQSTFEMFNRNPFAGVNAPVFDAQGVALAGSNFQAELWGGMSSDSLPPAVDYNFGGGRLIVSFGTDGYFYSSHSAFLLSIVPPGGGAWLQLRAWDARLGATYEQVSALSAGGYGESPLFYAQGGNPTTPTLPAPLIGLQSFNLRPVIPEPSNLALVALGNAALWGFNRRRRKPAS